jgi:hypothetical protein
MIERSGDTVCGVHRAPGDENCEFLGLASKTWSMVSPGLTSKLVALCLSVWASKPATTVC